MYSQAGGTKCNDESIGVGDGRERREGFFWESLWIDANPLILSVGTSSLDKD